MKISLLCVTAICIVTSNCLYAQTKKEGSYTGNYENTALKDVIHEIESAGAVKFFLAEKFIDTLTVTVTYRNESLENAIDILLDDLPVQFNMFDNKVSLFLDSTKQLSPSRYELAGSVSDNFGVVNDGDVTISVFMYSAPDNRPSARSQWEFKKSLSPQSDGVFLIDNLKKGRYRIKIGSDNHYKFSEDLIVTESGRRDMRLVRKGTNAPAEDKKEFSLKEKSILDRIVSIDVTNVPLPEVLNMIGSEAGFKFDFHPNLQWPGKKVTIQRHDISVRDLLNELLLDTSVIYGALENRLGLRTKSDHPGKFTLNGSVRDAATGESLIGASVHVRGSTQGTTTNQYGYYSLTMPEGYYTIVYSYTGYEPLTKEIGLFSNSTSDISLSGDLRQLDEVVVTADSPLRPVADIKMGVTTLGVNTIKAMPAFLGEADVIKSLTLLPGVSTVGEGTTGFNVRGGAIDQNLVILDEAPVYNTSHLFGFFSVFNADIVKDVNFYKSGIPARYGGRLSSVLDITQKEGNNQRFSGSGGIGILGARLALEGPIVKDKSSFIVAARKSYIGELLKGVEDFEDNSAGFYDLNAKVNFKINERNRVFWSAYSGKDEFTLGEDDIYLSYRNLTTTLRWNHIINSKLFSNFSAIYSNYKYVQGSTEENYEFRGTTGIVTYNAKSDFTYYLNAHHTIDFGVNCLLYQFEGLNVVPDSESSPIASFNIDDDYSFEPAVYIQDDYVVNDQLSLSLGLRYSGFYNVGPGTVYVYQDDVPREIPSIVDTIYYDNGELIKQYAGLEPRLSAKLALGRGMLQVSYDRSRQNIHLISNTTSATPLDIWRGSNTYIPPQIGDQYSIGYFRNLRDNAIETSVQIYYKDIQNIVDYKDGANLVLNKAIDADLLSGKGKAYGAEFSINKVVGRFNGWLSYAYSRTLRRVDGPSLSERINKGDWYPANYDIPHRVTLFATYKVTPLITLSSNFAFSSGRPTTYPDGRYSYSGMVIPHYAMRNQDRLPSYHRLDLSVSIDSKPHKRWRGQWVFSVYNVYSRKNAYSIYLNRIKHTQDTESIRLAIIGTAFPSITYNFKF